MREVFELTPQTTPVEFPVKWAINSAGKLPNLSANDLINGSGECD